MVSVPNTNLVKQHVSNLSRVRYCQVKQVLRLQYKEASKLPGLLKSIKDEIRLACPSVIADGSRPFRAHWTNFGDDHLEIVVDAHFEIKPTAPEYWDNRQRVLQAIHRAVRIHQVEFALPIKDMLSKTMPMGVPALR
jgi:small-conductance mechanosensitive channel